MNAPTSDREMLGGHCEDILRSGRRINSGHDGQFLDQIENSIKSEIMCNENKDTGNETWNNLHESFTCNVDLVSHTVESEIIVRNTCKNCDTGNMSTNLDYTCCSCYNCDKTSRATCSMSSSINCKHVDDHLYKYADKIHNVSHRLSSTFFQWKIKPVITVLLFLVSGAL
ncbi:hypothetical protein ACF0H5_023868 [Mactra antiquata]